ncbi:MAG: M3 family metallopeptidase [Solirubrobacterales bacterium]|nr:M3 family metallopeptidase [Solirubrobacterales bacterium]
MDDPLLDKSALPYGLPDFGRIRVADYEPAIKRAMAEQLVAIDRIIADPEPPSFANTLIPLELSGTRLERALAIFSNASAADTNDEIDALEQELAPQLAAHDDAILLNRALHQRLLAVAQQEEDLDVEDSYLLERYLTWFRLAGAGLSEQDQAALKRINGRISSLSSAFKIALQADSNDLALLIDDPAELDGLSAGERSAAAAAAERRGHPGKYLISLVLPTAHPYLDTLRNPDVRARLAAAQQARGARGNEHDTRATLLELLKLRAQRATLLGFENHAALRISDSTAKTPEAVREMLSGLASAAAANARREQARLEQVAGGPVSAADWPYYAEQVRLADHDLDLSALRPYFQADRVLHDGVFFAANRLFGLNFTERPDLNGYHPDVRVFEVSEEDGAPVGLYLLDLYTRESKRGGAWMSDLSPSLLGDTAIVVNNLNVPKPAQGEATLLTFDQTRTLFHEFGHALHGLLGKARYPSLAGTSVFRDFVEFPSQNYEIWMLWPEVLANYAPELDPAVVERLNAAQAFNQGYGTSEYLAAALLDLAWHSLGPEQVPTEVSEIAAFEAAALSAVGLDNPAVPPRYHTSYFSHIFSTGYAAAYYAYLWAEVLDADTERWFKDNGGLTRANGDAYRANVIGFGGTREPLAVYRAWRGRAAPIEPLLERRGLASAGT